MTDSSSRPIPQPDPEIQAGPTRGFRDSAVGGPAKTKNAGSVSREAPSDPPSPDNSKDAYRRQRTLRNLEDGFTAFGHRWSFLYVGSEGDIVVCRTCGAAIQTTRTGLLSTEQPRLILMPGEEPVFRPAEETPYCLGPRGRMPKSEAWFRLASSVMFVVMFAVILILRFT